jgi:uncharacterized protein YgiM (DUF1202 family)
MFRSRFLIALLILSAALASGTGALAQSNTNTLVRFVHAIPGAAAVDIYTAGQLTAAGLNFGEATTYIRMPAEPLRLTVTPAGATTPLWEQIYSPAAGRAFTLVASSFNDPIEFVPFEDTLEPLALGKARFTTIHAIADAPAVDVLLDDGRPLVLQQAYNQPFGTLDVPVFAYNLVVVPTGQGVDSALLTVDDAVLNTGTSYMLLLYGTAANPRYTLLSAATQPETADAGFVRLVHGVADAPAVDVYVADGVLAATLFPPTQGSHATEYLAIPAGTYAVELRANGTQDALLTSSLTVNSGDFLSAVALASADGLTLELFNDAVADITPDRALVRVVNGSADTISLSLADGTVIANTLPPGEASAISSTQANKLSVILSSAEAGMTTLPEQNFYGGVFYDILAFGNPVTLLDAAAALNRGPASGPGAVPALPVVVAEPTLPPPTTAVVVVEPTTVPEAPIVAVQPTAAPVVVPAPNVITGRVFNLNVDANLQLRQYPNTQALSLGTVPFGTILTVNGREGALAEIFISATQVPADYEYVDPVSLLENERQDLAPADTWLNVTYNTPDGGIIEAWVRADFIDVRSATGQRVPLRALDTVPGNQPGEARNTDITPPPVRRDVVTVRVINLDPTANLNVRRTPDVSSEVLAQLPLNTVAEFVSITEAGDWIFLRYAAPEGITTSGWASASFLQLELNGALTTLEELETKGLITIAEGTERGSQAVGAAPVVAPTVDPTIDAVIATVALDPGANLNLRRNPDVTAEVLAQVPSGTRLIVNARTDDAQWLNVVYEGITGWVAAQTDTAVFVTLSFNGAPFRIEDVPVNAPAG